MELSSFGVEGEPDFFATDLGQALLQVRDPSELAAMVGTAMLAVNAPSAGIWMSVVGASQGDEELSGFHVEMLALIRAQVEHVLRYIQNRGWLRSDVPFDDLVEACCIITCVETYVRFVQLDGKSPDEYSAFVTRTLRETILTP